jgi:hypothetical protein
MRPRSFPSSILSLAACLFTLGAASTAGAVPVELRNDKLQDNGMAGAVCGFNKGEAFAAIFTPPSYPAKLLHFRVFVAGVPLDPLACTASATTDAMVDWPAQIHHIHQGESLPGTFLQDFTAPFNNGNTLNEIDATPADVVINDGSFLVMFSLNAADSSPATDAMGANGATNYIFGDLGTGSSAWYSFDQLKPLGAEPMGNWVMRIDVDVPSSGGAGGMSGGGGAGGSAQGGAGSGQGGAGSGQGGAAAGGAEQGGAGAGGEAGAGGAAGTEAAGAAGGPGAGSGQGGAGSGQGGNTAAGASQAGAAGKPAAGAGGEAAGQSSGGAASATCKADADCSGGQVCDKDTSRCLRLACSADADCAGGQVCSANVCSKVCSVISDCKGGESCNAVGSLHICQAASAAAPAPAADDPGSSGGCAIREPARAPGAGALGLLVGALALARRRWRR